MIEKNKVMDMFIEACPSYKPRFDKYIAENYKPGEERLMYVDISDFIEHMNELHKNGKSEELEKIFNVVEQLYIHGDEFVKEFATIGILEVV
ncbi:DUF7674 family protein [Paenibacillus sp. SAF-054]|uniref:DUF7674 family protein n=1 Tax=unclassified Paenibacillus TaxID=185978 RepID=UPI003F7EA30F